MRGAGIVHVAPAGGVLEESFGVVAGRPGFGEGSGDCVPGEITEVLLRVIGNDLVDLLA
ncbi:hypothetical protein ABZW18_33370 [Streptomyces sp. NPDC004647]|uniref:hypothetical protein n=1 Tax=Streptomyces sp. NPDC004647 TaxID=3154671 RepID=UPI0033B75A18